MPFTRLFFYALLIFCTFASPALYAQDQVAFNTDLLPTTPQEIIPQAIPAANNTEQAFSPGDNLAMRSLWERIRYGFAMRDLKSPLVAKHEKWYASRPEYMAHMTERARRYLHYITVEVERRGMPSEIALLPMIESAFVHDAYSTGSASGIWQFIPSTGKKFGMQQNWWYDGRRNVISATNGALDYLQKLHDMFGDWELALAAYNCGEGAVQHAQERNRRRGLPLNYASLKIPKETRNYVPKLLAIRNIIANPDHFGLMLEEIPDEPYFAAVSTDRHIDAKLVALLAGISMDEFIALNSAHNRPVILQDNSDLILLPVAAVETFRATLEGYSKPLVSWQAYQPKKGERFDQIAQRFGLTEATLKSVNSLSERANTSSGQTLLVPVSNEENGADSEFAAFNMDISTARDRSIKYTVRKGDTLGSLARRYHVSVASLKSSSGSGKALRVGQVITFDKATSRRSSSRSSSRLSKSNDRLHKPV